MLERGGVSFHRTKSGGPRGWHRRPLFKYGMSWAPYLSEYCERHDLPTDAPIFDGGEAALEDSLTTLLQGSRWSGFAWHSLRRGGAASCWNQKPGLPYFKRWGRWASTGVAMRYATAFLDHGMLESLALPIPRAGVEDPPMVKCLSLWDSAMFGADGVEDSLGYVGAVLGPALPDPCAVAAEPHETVVGGNHGGPLGHESDSCSASSESSGSCDSPNWDVRIIDPLDRKGPTADPAFRISTGERPTAQGNGGGAGRRKRKRRVPPTTVRGEPDRRRVRALGVPSGHEGVGGAGWLAGGSGGCPRESPPHPKLCS